MPSETFEIAVTFFASTAKYIFTDPYLKIILLRLSSTVAKVVCETQHMYTCIITCNKIYMIPQIDVFNMLRF